MKKLRLNLDTLRVESFSTARGEEHRGGTVRGHNYTSDCPSQMIGCTWAGCNDSGGCVSGVTVGPPPSLYSCDATCQHAN